MMAPRHFPLSFNPMRLGQGYLILLWLVCVLILLPGCAAQPSRPDTSSPETSLVQETTAPGSVPSIRPASGILRLNRSPGLSLNPLLDGTAAGRAAQTLIFEPLFERDDAFQVVPVLVDSYSYDRERLQLTLLLDTTARFHDQQPLLASDVQSCLNFIRQHPESPYAAALAPVTRSYLVNETTLVIQLSQEDPDFLDALNFPVLKASDLDQPEGSLLQGTGRYRMEALDEAGVLHLKSVQTQADQPASLNQIQLIPMTGTREAMKAMEDDKLDLVLLPEVDFPDYQTRNSLRLERFTGQTYVDLLVNPRSQLESGVAAASLETRRFFQSARWFALTKPWPGQSADVPLPANHPSLGHQPFALALDPSTSTEKQPSAGLKQGQPVAILFAADKNLSLRLAQQAADWLTEAGYETVLDPQPADAYEAALQAGTYDLAIRETVVPASFDPEWLLSMGLDPTGDPAGSSGKPDGPAEPSANAATDAQGLKSNPANSYDKSQESLSDGRRFFGLLGYPTFSDPAEQALAVEQYRQNLAEAAQKSPSIGLMLRDAAIAYGDRIQGQLRPSWQQPFRGIEELWVWSGLSSS